MKTAADRLRATLVGRLLLPTTFVEVKADDIVEVCGQVPQTDDDQRFADIRLGSANAPGLDVYVPATNVEWLLSHLPAPVAPAAVAAEAQADPQPVAEAATDVGVEE